jgi:hypothetical protein
MLLAKAPVAPLLPRLAMSGCTQRARGLGCSLACQRYTTVRAQCISKARRYRSPVCCSRATGISHRSHAAAGPRLTMRPGGGHGETGVPGARPQRGPWPSSVLHPRSPASAGTAPSRRRPCASLRPCLRSVHPTRAMAALREVLDQLPTRQRPAVVGVFQEGRPARAQPPGQMAGVLCPAAQEAHRAVTAVEGDIPALAIPACGSGDPAEQPHPTRLGDLLGHRRRKPLLWLCAGLGGKEGATPPDACTETAGLRLEEGE